MWSLAVATLAAPLLQHLNLCQRQPCSTHLRKVLFGPSYAPNPSSASETASEGLSGHLTWCLGRTQQLRSASSSASETASEGLLRHLTWCLGRTLLLFGTFKPLSGSAPPLAVLQRLLRKASQAISPGALAALCFL